MTTKTIDKEALLKGINDAKQKMSVNTMTHDPFVLGFIEGGRTVLALLTEGIASGRFDTKDELQVFTEAGLEDTNPDDSGQGIVYLSADIKGAEREELAQHFRNKGYTVI